MTILNVSTSNYCDKTFEISQVASNYDVRCSVKGGGLFQAGAIILGISKALINHDENLKKT